MLHFELMFSFGKGKTENSLFSIGNEIESKYYY